MTAVQPRPFHDVAHLTALTRAAADTIERERQLSTALLDEYRQAGLLRLTLPAALGGEEADLPTFLRIIEELSQADGSAGWLVMVQNHHTHLSAYASDEALREIWVGNPDVLLAGGYVPRGRAVPVEGGYVINGCIPYGSGIAHAAWLASGFRVYDGDQVRLGEDGKPLRLLALTPVSAARVLDTWTTTGLRGTGSHDYELHDVFVPSSHVIDPDHPPDSRFKGPLYVRRGPIFMTHGAHALGVARAALDALVELVQVKPTRTDLPHQRDRSIVQVQLAEAEALLESARAFLYDTAERIWEHVVAGEEPPGRLQAHARLALVHSVRSAVQAVEKAYYLGGGTSVYATCQLDRCMRDAHTASGHLQAAVSSYEHVGHFLVGLDDGKHLM